jgi:hypothetical protein
VWLGLQIPETVRLAPKDERCDIHHIRPHSTTLFSR